jgi:hypothetical protein
VSEDTKKKLEPIKVHVIFDLERDRLNARNFLKELMEQNWPLQVTGASKRESIAATQRELVMVETMRKASRALVLISPSAAVSRNIGEEVKLSKSARLRLVGVLINGATAYTHLPEGMHRSQIVGWDWAALKKMMF